tara:strand:+ start:580 stop:1314 length:735 start_codon:yes stop_codon:yes gene_type:complete
MKFNLFILLILLVSCKPTTSTKYVKKTFYSKGFAYIYNEKDYENKIINKKIKPNEIIISSNNIKKGTLLKISNPTNGKNIIAKNTKKINYPDFYKILIVENIAEQLKLNKNFPYIEIEEIKKNKSFIAKKAEMHADEKQIPNKAPVEKVKISNLGKKTLNKSDVKPKFVIILGNFYSLDSAKSLKKRIYNESLLLRNKKISIKKINNNNYEVFLGPYYTINIIKNDYIALKQINFEEIDVKIIK